MCTALTKETLLQRISNFTTEEVVALLLRNKLTECCDAVLKRQIGGEQFLRLREDNLILWKRDLGTTLRWSLSQFVEDVNNNPEHYLYFDEPSDTLSSSSRSVDSEEFYSDHSDDWDTEFDEEETYDPSVVNRGKKSSVSYSEDNSSSNCVECDQESDEMEEIYSNDGVSAEIYRHEGMVNRDRYIPSTPQRSADDLGENIYQNGAGRIENAGPSPIRADREIANEIKSNDSKESRLVAELRKGLEQKGLCQKSPMGPKPPTGPKPALTSLKRPPICNRNEALPPVVGRSKAHLFPVEKSPKSTSVTETSKTAKSIERPKVTQTMRPDFIQSLGAINSKPPGFRQPTSLLKKPIPKLPPPPVNNSYRKPPTNLPKPPAAPIEKFRNLHDDEHDSDDDTYEPVNSQLRVASMEDQLNLRLQQLNSSSSIENGNFEGSSESVYQARSESSHEEFCDNESEYEVINEAKLVPQDQVDDEYLKPVIHRSLTANSVGLGDWEPYTPTPRFPEKTQDSLSEEKMAILVGDLKRSVSLNTAARRQASLSECLTQAALTEARSNLSKRSPNPKSATLPHSGTQGTSGSHVKVIRPLPPPPNPQRLDRAHQQQSTPIRNGSIDGKSYKNKPWYHNISREEAIALIEAASSSRPSPSDGYFLVRPSSANNENPLVLVVYYRTRAYNIPVRKRSDNRYALGTSRSDEFAFASVEEMIQYHSTEEISIKSKGVLVGHCRLTKTPPFTTNES